MILNQDYQFLLLEMSIHSDPSEILPNLWIGDLFTAADSQFFRDKNIRAVVNCTPDIPDYFIRECVAYHRVNCDDLLQEKDFSDMLAAIPQAIQWIYHHYDERKRPTFVHCHKGIQRSCTIVAAFLFHTRQPDLKECINFIISKRPIAFFGGRSINFINPLKQTCIKK